jgi:tetrahydromethanopterin:alpha-L-glutamate ligase
VVGGGFSCGAAHPTGAVHTARAPDRSRRYDVFGRVATLVTNSSHVAHRLDTHGRRGVTHPHRVDLAVIAHQLSETNLALAARGWRGAESHLFAPRDALLNLRAGDVALNRLDVSDQLDGVEEGLWIVNQLEAQGIRVFNRPPALLAAHDKLITARLLIAVGIPHPRTRRLHHATSLEGLALPVVAKPRFGSWGRDVELCGDRRAFDDYIRRMQRRNWWRTGGVVQELVPPRSSDLRIIVSAGDVVGAAVRLAAPGEWRTNVALGGRPIETSPPAEACELALAATRQLGIDFAGVDLLPDEDGWVVVEVNGAVDMRPIYSLGGDVFSAALASLERLAHKPSLASQW